MDKSSTPHIAVCICTYKRPNLLRRLLEDLKDQQTDGLFAYSIVVVDNDQLESAKAATSEFGAASSVPITYCVEPQQNIARARNRAVANAKGDFIAFIDDDEFPTRAWLLTLFKQCVERGVDGVLGPVKPHYDVQPPKWVIDGKFYDRPSYPTGFVIDWRKGRTGNVLLRSSVFEGMAEPFRLEFGGGAEDQDFFRRMIESGKVFIWCDEAVAYEVVPPIRWKRTFMIRRALLRGKMAFNHPTARTREIAKSMIAVPIYAVALPFTAVLGHHRFMNCLLKLFDHAGKVLALFGLNPAPATYVTESLRIFLAMDPDGNIINCDAPILVTGATGFIGGRVVENLVGKGFRNVRCFARNSSDPGKIEKLGTAGQRPQISIFKGNLLSREDCVEATRGVALIYHLAAGRGEKSFPDAFMNSVVATRNLLEGTLGHKCLKRFVNISSFSVYSNQRKPKGNVLDESCPVEERPELRGDAYSFAKVKQDQIVAEYGKKHGIPYVLVRPGVVYGPGTNGITGRVGLGTFGLFLHLGGSNPIPLTYVDNCAEAIVLAGIKQNVNGEVFNVVDDELPSSSEFLHRYKKHVKRFRSLYVPRSLSYLLCCFWEKYSNWSQGQLPPTFNRRAWHAYWKKTSYTNEKVKRLLGWSPVVSTSQGLELFFQSCREGKRNA